MIQSTNSVSFIIFRWIEKFHNDNFTCIKEIFQTYLKKSKLHNISKLNSYVYFKINLSTKINISDRAARRHPMYTSLIHYMEGVCTKF